MSLNCRYFLFDKHLREGDVHEGGIKNNKSKYIKVIHGYSKCVAYNISCKNLGRVSNDIRSTTYMEYLLNKLFFARPLLAVVQSLDG